MVPFETIRTEVSHGGQVAVVTLALPPANILSSAMMEEISTYLLREKNNESLKLIVFQGEGDNFSFGASVEEHTADRVRGMLPGFHRMIGEILEYPIPTVAAVKGFCLGGGFELALACSMIAAEENAKFAVPEIQLGVFPPVAAALLPALASGAVAARMVLTGARMSAAELKDAGVVSMLCGPGELNTTLDAFIAKEIVTKSASSLRFAHQALRMAIVRSYRGLINDLEGLYLDELMETHDANEGIQSFLEKRSPAWANS